MKKIIIICLFLFSFLFIILLFQHAYAKKGGFVFVKPYIKPSIGTIVQPHFKTTPNKFKFDNWSTKGNENPFTGRKGTK